jgi:hypothetical protein
MVSGAFVMIAAQLIASPSSWSPREPAGGRFPAESTAGLIIWNKPFQENAVRAPPVSPARVKEIANIEVNSLTSPFADGTRAVWPDIAGRFQPSERISSAPGCPGDPIWPENLGKRNTRMQSGDGKKGAPSR